MASGEERLRMVMRSRAWDVRAAVPEGLDLPAPIEELAREGGYEVVVLLKKPAAAQGPPHPPPAPTLSLEPVQRFLPGCWLTDVERGIVEALLGAGHRMTSVQLREAVEARLGRPVGEGTMKILLARMTDPQVRILSNDRGADPPGYAVTPDYRAFLAWVAQAARPGQASA